MDTIRDYFHKIADQLNIISSVSEDVSDAVERLKVEPNSVELKDFINSKITEIRNASFKSNAMISKIKFPTYMLVDPDVGLDQLEDRIKVKFKEITIHIVEDDEVQCHWLETTLRKKGFKVTSSKNMVDAINYVVTNNPYIVILDLHVPAVDGGTEISMGTDLLDAIKDHSSGTQIIVVTAENDEKILQLIEDKYKPLRIVSKPASREKLESALSIAVTKAATKFIR
jgi:CheY-like chemotaxis protein